VKVAILLHLYQPITQEETVFKQVYSECYLPLLKLIKNKKSVHFTLNVPLSLFELMDKYGHADWVSDLKELHNQDRVELTGCAAYHSLLTKIPTVYAEKQIVLNEYGLGYYVGAHRGFEGEPTFLLKNVNGFFPPELAVSNNVAKLIDSFGYNWILADETALPWEVKMDRSKSDAYNLAGLETKLVIRDRDFSNILSFKRDLETQDISNYVRGLKHRESAVVVALDGETFGHHYKDGIYLLESVLDILSEEGIDVLSVSDSMDYMTFKDISGVVESTWGASDADIACGNIYPYWDIQDNDLQKLLWNLETLLLNTVRPDYAKGDLSDYTNTPIWKDSALAPIEDKKIVASIQNTVLLLKFMNSDKYWWSSRQTLPNGKTLYHPGMINSSLDIAMTLARSLDDTKLGDEIAAKLQDIKALL